MSEKLVTLEAWAANLFGEKPPHIVTLRRWVREARILPRPKKHGRCYYVSESARYFNYDDPDYARAARESTKTQ